jgi:hypothetical protein
MGCARLGVLSTVLERAIRDFQSSSRLLSSGKCVSIAERYHVIQAAEMDPYTP